jgi:hypothetical protein
LNNWRAVGYIFLGWGSVFLVLALTVFLSSVSLLSGVPFLNSTPIALVASATWLIIASLAYVVGFVCYFAGREAYGNRPPKRERQPISGMESDARSLFITVSIVAALAMIALTYLWTAHQFISGIMGNSDVVSAFALPTIVSIAVGLVAGLVAYIIATIRK